MEQQPSSMQRKGLLVALFVGVGVLAAAAAVVTVQVLESIDDQVDGMSQQLAGRASQAHHLDDLPFPVELSIAEEASSATGLVLQIRSIESQDIEAEGRDKQEWIYLVGLFENQSPMLVRDLEAEFRVLDSNGKELWIQYETQLTSGQIEYRPGDVIPLRVFLKPPIQALNEPDIGNVEVILSAVEGTPYGEAKGRDIEVDFTWAEPRDSSMDVVVRARSLSGLGEAEKETESVSVYAVENTGQFDFQRLSLAVEWTDTTGTRQEEVCAVVTGPALQTGDEFLVACGTYAKKEGDEPSFRLLDFQ